MLTNNVMALKGKRARRAAGLHGRREYENIFLLWQNKEFLETEVFKDYPACITQMGVLYMPIMVLSIFAAGSVLTHLLSFPFLPRAPSEHGQRWSPDRRDPAPSNRAAFMPLDFYFF